MKYYVVAVGVLVLMSVVTFGKRIIRFPGPVKVFPNIPFRPISELPESYDIRNVNGINYGTHVLNQQSPNVCGSCWAEAATGALSDRFSLYTQRKLSANLSPQILLNFDKSITGGSCNGGDQIKAYEFISKYGIVDDTCQPFVGLNWLHGFEVAAKTEVESVQARMCFTCGWGGTCGFVPVNYVEFYGIDSFGQFRGEEAMMNEIVARGPIACELNSDAYAFYNYTGGIITCPRVNIAEHPECFDPTTDHVVVIAGYGVDSTTGMKYWVGRNSYGTRWGEGAGGGWFRLERGVNALNVEDHPCAWAVPSNATIERILKEYDSTL